MSKLSDDLRECMIKKYKGRVDNVLRGWEYQDEPDNDFTRAEVTTVIGEVAHILIESIAEETNEN